MSTEIDFTSLKSIKPRKKSLVFGYIKREFKQTRIVSSENAINYTILAFYSEICDTFSIFLDGYDISKDGKCFSGCGYGKYEINPNDKRYNRYQWLIKINQCRNYLLNGCDLGITSFADTNKPWCWNKDIIGYNFNSVVNLHGCLFSTGDLVLLDLNTTTQELKIYINGKLGGNHKHINCQNGIKYRFAAFVFDGICFITIEAFSKFNDTLSSNCYDLLNYNGEISHRYHPNGQIDINCDEMQLKWKKPESPEFRPFRRYDLIDNVWRIVYYGPSNE